MLHIVKISDEDLMILATNAIFLIILLISVYGIGSVLYNSNIGLLSALLTTMLPLVFGNSRIAMIDYPLMCMISLSIYLLLKTNGFRSLRYSIFFGVVIGLSQITKETSSLFIFAPLIYYFMQAYFSGERKKVLLNFSTSMLFFFIVAGSVFLKTTNLLFAFKNYWVQISALDNTDPFYYFKGFFLSATGPFVLALSLSLLPSYLINFKKRNKLLFLWFFIPIVLFSLFTNKMHRFLMPVLPALSLIVIQELFTSEFYKILKTSLRVILIPGLMLQYVFINTGVLKTKYYQAQFDYGILSVKKDRYFPVNSALIEVFRKEAGDPSHAKGVLFTFYKTEIITPFFNRFYNLPFYVVCPMTEAINTVALPGTLDNQEIILKADYIVEKIGFVPGEQVGLRGDLAEPLRKEFKKNKYRFRLIAEIKTPDNFSICVYRRVPGASH